MKTVVPWKWIGLKPIGQLGKNGAWVWCRCGLRSLLDSKISFSLLRVLRVLSNASACASGRKARENDTQDYLSRPATLRTTYTSRRLVEYFFYNHDIKRGPKPTGRTYRG